MSWPFTSLFLSFFAPFESWSRASRCEGDGKERRGSSRARRKKKKKRKKRRRRSEEAEKRRKKNCDTAPRALFFSSSRSRQKRSSPASFLPLQAWSRTQSTGLARQNGAPVRRGREKETEKEQEKNHSREENSICSFLLLTGTTAAAPAPDAVARSARSALLAADARDMSASGGERRTEASGDGSARGEERGRKEENEEKNF